MREATAGGNRWRLRFRYFNPRLPCGRRLRHLGDNRRDPRFQSPPPMREATFRCSRFASHLNFNPRLPCGRRQEIRNLAFYAGKISIPASHAGGDQLDRTINDKFCISIPASHAGGDPESSISMPISIISIPASHAGGDGKGQLAICSVQHFNPRLPCGRRPGASVTFDTVLLNFNPRLPCGRRRSLVNTMYDRSSFQSPPPMREATARNNVISRCAKFQSPPPMREATLIRHHREVAMLFQSPPPMREATFIDRVGWAHIKFQSPPPMREATDQMA